MPLHLPRRTIVGTCLCLTAAAAAWAGSLWLAASPSDAWAQGPYVPLSNAVGWVPGLASFSVAEWVLLAAAIAIIAYLIVSLRAIIKAGRGSRLTTFWRRAIQIGRAHV